MGLFERERFPRFHIGESLIPETYWVLKRLGMLTKMQRSHFVKKYSVQFVNASGKLSAPFYFWDNKPHECSQTWQVVRSEFDQMMLDNAREHGVDAHEGVHVLDVLFEGDRAVGVRIKDADGTRRDVRAKVVVDASGQAALLQNRFKLRLWDPDPEQRRDLDLLGGRLSRHRPRRRRDDGAADRRTRTAGSGTSRCTTTSSASASSRRSTTCSRAASSHEQTYQEEVERCPAVKQRRRRREAGRPAISLTRDYSYRSTTVAGDGWVLVGDAFGFLDPLYSSGVLLALKSGELAADAIADGLARRRHQRARSSDAWGENFNDGVDRMRRLVCEYYDGFSFGNFVRNYPELRGTVTDLLIGDLFTDRVDKVWGPMESLYEPDKKPIPTWHAGHDRRRHPGQGQRARPPGRAAAVAGHGVRHSAIRGASSSPRPTSPASSISRGCFATWKRPSTRHGVPQVCRSPKGEAR